MGGDAERTRVYGVAPRSPSALDVTKNITTRSPWRAFDLSEKHGDIVWDSTTVVRSPGH